MFWLLLSCSPQPVAAAGPSCVLGPEWSTWGPGLETRLLQSDRHGPVGDGQIVVVRADPTQWELTLTGPALAENTSAKAYARRHQLTLATNAGMFATDYKTHVGELMVQGRTMAQPNTDYQSVAEFGPRLSGEPAFRIRDLDVDRDKGSYDNRVQNLRLIKRPGENRWKQQDKRWSEMALGEDKLGRALFVFSRSPHTMHDLNAVLLASDIEIVAAQHLEGGPEAQLFVQVGDCTLEQVGSYETGFNESDDNALAWPIPNALGVRAR